MHFYLDARPLEKLLPVDEFLPIMFNQHQNKTWKKHFPNRNLVAWSAAPLLLFPTHYTGESGYLSDTENSDVIKVLGEIFGKRFSVHIGEFKLNTNLNTTISDGENAEKKGNKEIPNDSTMTETQSTNAANIEKNVETAHNASMDTSFIVKSVNEHSALQHTSEQHTEL